MKTYTFIQGSAIRHMKHLIKLNSLLNLHKLKDSVSFLKKLFFLIFSVGILLPVSAQTVRSATGATVASIVPARDAFRTDLGGSLNPNLAGSFVTGRREINWDGVPDALAAPNNLPANFFNVNSPRGAIFSTPGTGFQVSANAANPTSTPVEFSNINPIYSTLFAPFSAQRLFTAIGSNITDVNFFFPGSNTPAVVSGFGAVFSDVDLAGATSIQLFDQNNVSLGTFLVPATSGNETFSFIGVSYPTAIISRVRITSGNIVPGTNETAANDVVVMDDFIYGEPVGFQATIRSISGVNAAAISPTRDQFRLDLGTLNPNVAGSFGTGRREINWDGVPDAFSAPNNLPANFFNVNSPRGVILSSPGTGLQVSANASNPTSTPVEFGNINPAYPGLFITFSPQRLFTALGSNITDVTFFIPGTTTPALTKSFGSIFTDVDLAGASSIQYFDANNISLGTYNVPNIAGNETVSFLGLSYLTTVISRVRLISGNTALGAGINETASIDPVVMDDFIYGEPTTPCVLTCPANIIVSNTNGQCGAVVNYPAPTTSGGCGTVTATPASGSFFAVGTTTVNVSSTTGQTCSFTITVNDAQAPSITTCPTVSPFCVNSSGNYTIPALLATDNCPGLTVSYLISGATTRTGTGNNASGAFAVGISTINWTVRDAAANAATCQTTVTVNTNPVVTIPDAFALPSGVAANTVYIGYQPASSITVTAIASGGTPPYTYTWSSGSHASSITVSPTVTTTYTVTVTDANGCEGTASKTIFVVDVRCGNKLDKVQVCQVPPGKPSNAHGICISPNAVASHLNNGSYLGTCTGRSSTSSKGVEAEEVLVNRLTIQAISNPAPLYFTLITKSNTSQPLQIKVFNALGSVVEVRSNAAANSVLQLGQSYRPGIYYAEVVQGKQRVMIKLVKVSR